jgi:hypothetical protein
MNPIFPLQERCARLKKTGAAVLGALAMMSLSAAPAMATTINFESLLPTTYDGGALFSEAGYNMLVLDSIAGSGSGFAGGIANGLDPFSCAITACPVGNNSFFYMGVNDGGLKLSRNDSAAFSIKGLDYAFLAPIEGLPNYAYGQLTLVGQKVGGGTLATSFDFPMLNGNGNSIFTSTSFTSAFGNTAFSSLVISACLFDDANHCYNPAGNQAQFSIDNVSVTAVPEPSTYAMLGLGLAAIGLVSRRRANRAPVVITTAFVNV